MPEIPLGAAVLGSGLLGAGASIFGANAQANAAQAGIAAQQGMFQQGLDWAGQQLGNAQSALNPFITAGSNALGAYEAALPGLTQPFNAGSLVTTPGYEFALTQGLKGVQSSLAPQGLAGSGPAARGAAAYATGLAQNTYNQQFQNYLTQNAQIGNLLFQPAATGASAASTLAGVEGTLGAAGLGGAVSTGQGIAGSLAGYGNALAGGAAGVAGAASSGLNSYLQYNLLNRLLTGGGAGGTSTSATSGAYTGGTGGLADPSLLASTFNSPGYASTIFNPFSG